MVDLTEEEIRASERAILQAAYDVLCPANGAELPEFPDEIARLVLRAMRAAEDAKLQQIAMHEKAKGISVFLSRPEPSDAVATAFWMVVEDVGLGPEEVSACSIQGQKYIGFAMGLCAARQMTQALELLEDDGAAFAFSTRGLMAGDLSSFSGD